jgi:hypothetical protein
MRKRNPKPSNNGHPRKQLTLREWHDDAEKRESWNREQHLKLMDELRIRLLDKWPQLLGALSDYVTQTPRYGSRGGIEEHALGLVRLVAEALAELRQTDTAAPVAALANEVTDELRREEYESREEIGD